jgi:hypothetical protein
VAQAQLLLQFLIIPLDDPTVFRQLHQSLQLGPGGQRRDPVLGGFGFSSRPLDE